MAATVFLLGPSSFRIASELLRFPVDAEEQHQLPPLRVVNKYFSLPVYLSWSRGTESQTPCTLHSEAASGRPFGGVLVVSAEQCCSRLGPLQAEWFAVPQSAAFRVALLCISPRKLPDDLHAEWVRRSLDAGFELVFHEADVTSCESFEHVPLGAERFGLLQEELSGSARLLQLIHNTAWILPSPASLPTTNNAAGAVDGGSSTQRTVVATILMVGSHEADAIALLRSVGAVLPAAEHSELPSPLAARNLALHLSHKYGDLHGVPIAFLPQSLFRSACIDVAHTFVPQRVQVVVFVDVDGPQSAQRAMSAETIDLCRRAFRGHAQQPDTFVWVAVRRASPLHEAEVDSIESRGVELVMVSSDESAARETSVDVKGLRRLHEMLACAYHPYSIPRDSASTCTSSSAAVHATNRLLWVDIRSDAHKETTFMHEVLRHSHGTLEWNHRQQPHTTLEVRNKYAEATVRCHYSGATAPVADLATFLSAFHVVIVVADSLVNDAVLRHWAEALSPTVGGDDDDGGCHDLSGDPEAENSRLLWFCETLGEQQLQRIDGMNLRIEVTYSTDVGCDEQDAQEFDDPVEGAARVAEVIASHPWQQRVMRKQPKHDGAQGDSSQSTAASAACIAKLTDEPSVTKPTSGAFEHPVAEHDDTVATCEPPPHMFVDPDTLRTVCVPELLGRAGGDSPGSAPSHADGEDVLVHWMHKLKTKGHLLRRSDRQRQALILAEKLGESLGDDGTAS